MLCELETIQTVRTPRYSFHEPGHRIRSIDLHGFADSSKSAYAGVVYARIKTDFGTHVSLLAAKTKVAPLKPLSVPRLELLGCTLLCKLLRQICEGLDCKVEKVFGWSDSEVVLCWIKGKSRD